MAKQSPTDHKLHPLELSGRVIAGRWKPLILWHLYQGPQRFGELHRLVTPITRAALTQKLRQLEADGLVARHVSVEISIRVAYSLTPLGRSTRPILDALMAWSSDHLDEIRGDLTDE